MRSIIVFIIIAGTVASTALADPWKFAVMADSNVNDANDSGDAANILGSLVNDLKLQDIDFVIFPGDLAERESYDSLDVILDIWKSQMKPLYDVGTYVYTIRGNHDLSNSVDDSYLNLFPLAENATSPDGGYTYAFTHRNAKFIGFDQYINRKASFNSHLYSFHSNKGQMMNHWVVSQINNSTSPLNFAFAHEPLFPSKSHRDCMANDPDSRDALVTALGTHNGTYFCGHDHMYLRGTASDGHGHTVPDLVVGTAGGANYDYAQIKATGYKGTDSYTVDKVYGDTNEPYYGYLLVTVYDNNTWTGQFKGFRYNAHTSETTAINTLDSFVARQENRSQAIS